MPRPFSSLLHCALFALAGATFAGCSRGDPRASPIEAPNPARLAAWRTLHAERIRPAEWREFDRALQEIRLGVMADRAASGAEAIEAAMCSRIHRRTFGDVLLLGYETKLARLEPVRREMKSALDANALVVTKAGDRSSANYLEELRERQTERLRKLDEEIDAAEARLAELGGAERIAKIAGREVRPPRTLATAALTREEAMAEFKQLVFEQRGAATLKYGEWPVRFDREGTQLFGAERADFLARRTAAAANGHTAIAVRVGERWWIFDESAELPQLGRVITANLTPGDFELMRLAWSDLQAEIWARRQAREEADRTP